MKKVVRAQPINANKVRKVARLTESVLVEPTERVLTEYGYVTKSIDTPFFSTYVKVIAAGCVDATVLHPKKIRTYRVLSGSGFFYSKLNQKAKAEVVSLKKGDEVVCDPGTTYKVLATGTSHIELQVIEDTKYEARLEIISPAEAMANPELPEYSDASEENGYNMLSMRDKLSHSKRTKELQAQKAQERATRTGNGGGIISALPASFVPEKINAMPTIPV